MGHSDPLSLSNIYLVQIIRRQHILTNKRKWWVTALYFLCETTYCNLFT